MRIAAISDLFCDEIHLLDCIAVLFHHDQIMTEMHNKTDGNNHRILKDVFGFNSFRPDQEEIIQAILSKQDCFVVMPTGGGKSLCYQLPAHIMDGTCVVISPLISLMKDQVDAAIATGLRASFLNSSLSFHSKCEIENQLADGELDLIYVSPERFAMPEFIATLKSLKLSFVAIDEAHCVSEWGHDFRPDYLNLSRITRDFPDVPVTAFTATATHRVQDDIVEKLNLRSPHTVRASFNRPNLFYKVIPKNNPGSQILKFVREHVGEQGIVYRTTRKNVEQTAAMLAKNGIKALPYHAGLPDSVRVQNQNAFNKDEIEVIVATIAFGMGIDKSNVRFVLHGDLPKNMESYYQETGRSGRDGEQAQCLLLFGYGDIPKMRFFIDQITDETEHAHQLRCLNDMVHYATVHACRRKQLLNYFGEEYPPKLLDIESSTFTHSSLNIATSQKGVSNDHCATRRVAQTKSVPISERHSEAQRAISQNFLETPPTINHPPSTNQPCCDICSGEVKSIDATRDAQIVMSAIVRTGERFGITHIIAVVTGEDSDRIRQLGHDQIKTYGVGRDQDKRHWRILVDNLLAQGLILQTPSDYPVIQLQPAARDVLFGDRQVQILKTLKTKGKKRTRNTPSIGGPYNEELFEQLRALRKELASEQHVPPFVIFSDKTLHEMARSFPTTEDQMLQISGVGDTKLERYGNPFAKIIKTFKETQ